jgi:hypothetical protein
MKPYNDGISDLQMDQYRAQTSKREKKDKAIKAAAEQRKRAQNDRANRGDWNDSLASVSSKAMGGMHGSQTSFAMRYST